MFKQQKETLPFKEAKAKGKIRVFLDMVLNSSMIFHTIMPNVKKTSHMVRNLA